MPLLLLILACRPSASETGASDDTGDAGVAVEDLTALVAEVVEGKDLPALGAAWVDHDGLRGLGATGLRRADEDGLEAINQVTAADRWHLGSDTKAMTATELAMTVDEGLLAWETTVPEAFPGLPVDPGWNAITLLDLVHHRGGADSDLAQDHPDIWAGLWERDDGCAARQWFAEQLLADPPSEPVGTYVYSNAGYMLVGTAIENATGQCWQDHIEARLFEPLGMDDCGFGAPQGDEQPWGHVVGSDGALESVPPTRTGSDNPPGLGPAGTVHCSLASWAAFAELHLDAARGEPRLVSAEGFERLHTPEGSYAGGWGVSTTDRGLTLMHAGSNTMWYAWAVIEPEQDRAWLVTTNAGTATASRVVERMVERMVEAVPPTEP